MKWKWLNFTRARCPNEFWDFRGSLGGYRFMRASNGGTRVPVWVWSLWEFTRAECAASWGAHPERDPRPSNVFRERLRRAACVVNKPGGVDPEAFSAALALGGWDAVCGLDKRLSSWRET